MKYKALSCLIVCLHRNSAVSIDLNLYFKVYFRPREEMYKTYKPQDGPEALSFVSEAHITFTF